MCPISITFDEIKLAIAYFQHREYLKNLGVPFKDNYTIETVGDEIVYTSVTKPVKSETITTIDDEECDSDKTVIEDEEFDSTVNKENQTAWEEDDFLLDNIDQIQKAESLIIESESRSVDTKPLLKHEQPKSVVNKLCKDSSSNKRKIFFDNSDSDENNEECNTGEKMDIIVAKNIMKKKISKNSIFN